MNFPDRTAQPRRRAPRGRGAYLWVIERVPDRYEPSLRGAATTVRNRRLRIRLFRERWIRRLRRSIRRSERAWRRRMRRMRRFAARQNRSLQRGRRIANRRIRRMRRGLYSARRRQQDGEHNEEVIGRYDLPPDEQLAWAPRGRIIRAMFPPAVRFPGDGELVVIDATGHSTEEIIEHQDHLPRRVLVVTDAPSVGALRTAGIPYEYLPTSSVHHRAETFLERLLWLDDVYGIDRIERLDHYSGEPPDDSTYVDRVV